MRVRAARRPSAIPRGLTRQRRNSYPSAARPSPFATSMRRNFGAEPTANHLTIVRWPKSSEKHLGRLADCIDRGLAAVSGEHEPIREYVEAIGEVAATLEPGGRDGARRQKEFEGLIDRFERTADPIRRQMATVMISFLAGLFVGGTKFEGIRDNLDLERWFRLPKSHERRIHGHRHAGDRIVQEGPTLVHALDAHAAHPAPFTVEDLLPYRTVRAPIGQRPALNRRKIMRKARSKKKRPMLLAELERRYREMPVFLLFGGSLFFL